MKSILYIGGALMAGATIYGFIDYNKTNGSKEFNEMYESETKITEPRGKEVSTATLVESKSALADELKGPNIEEAKAEPEKTFRKTESGKSKAKKSKFRKLDSEIFSRASLKKARPIIEDTVVAESKIEVLKEQ